MRNDVKNIIIKELNLDSTKDLYEQTKELYYKIHPLFHKKYNNIKLKELINNSINYDLKSPAEKMFHIMNNMYEIPNCPVCKKNKLKFSKMYNRGYYKACSRKCVNESKEVIEKRNKTNRERYGGNSPMSSKTVREKHAKVIIEKYGCVNPSQNKQIKEKAKQTLIKKYGVDNTSKNEEIKEKRRQINLERYGYENPMQSPEVYNKNKQTFLNKYGADHPSKVKEICDKLSEGRNKTLRKKAYDKLSEEYSDKYEFLFTEEEYTNKYVVYKFKCKKCNNIFEKNLNGKYFFKCPYCYPSYKSISEQNLYEWTCSIIGKDNIISGDRSVLKSKELDIYIPKYKLAIEYNGIYWHSTKIKSIDINYHYNKYLKCENQNIDLLQIWENEFSGEKNQDKRNVIKSIIYRKLNYQYKIRPENFEIKEINNKNIIKKFIDNNSLNEYVGFDYCIGMFYDKNLIAILYVKDEYVYYVIKNYYDINNGMYYLLLNQNKYNKLYICQNLRVNEYNVDNLKFIERVEPQEKLKNNKFLVYNCGYEIYQFNK